MHAELDEEEVPEGFTVGLGNDASRTNPEEQASGGKKRAADEVLLRAPCPVRAFLSLAMERTRSRFSTVARRR